MDLWLIIDISSLANRPIRFMRPASALLTDFVA